MSSIFHSPRLVVAFFSQLLMERKQTATIDRVLKLHSTFTRGNLLFLSSPVSLVTEPLQSCILSHGHTSYCMLAVPEWWSSF